MATDKSNIRLNKYTSGKEEKQMLLCLYNTIQYLLAYITVLKFHIDGQLQTSRKILIVPAIPRIGEDEPPPSWDFVLTPKAMVGRGSPKLSMIPKGSPKFGRMLSAASTRMKTVSPQSILAKKTASSPKGNQVKQRAIWNAELEKSLVEILFEYKVNGCRGDNGWTTKGWNRMVKEFHAGNKCVSFTKNQVQEEGQLKRDYKMLKATFPKIKKFRNNKASFPLYDALGELYDANAETNHVNHHPEHILFFTHFTDHLTHLMKENNGSTWSKVARVTEWIQGQYSKLLDCHRRRTWSEYKRIYLLL
ncbi:hypothetical protein OsI_35927 [Oryza sativa Indica Group]|uniref:Myb/SANT-like domain-containing protein n=1 Tax=Oryza sativa subsp. indica TaxID=39946 RepID=B8BK84_ORYSI|nr:hypothetical protein OsI_35927 [Oryza sativa Indica Group]